MEIGKFFVFVVLLFSLSLVLAVDLETRVGYFGDEELMTGGVGDSENAVIGSGEDLIAPVVTVNSPSEGVTYTSSPVFFNVSLNEAGSCNYSLDEGVNNYSMSFSGLSGIATREVSSGSYSARFYCEDAAGNLNSSAVVSFVVSISSVEETPAAGGGGGGGGGGGSATILPSQEVKLDLDYESFKVRSVINDKKSREFSVKNEGNDSVVVVLSVEGEDVELSSGEIVSFAEFVKLSENSISLESGEELHIDFEIIAPNSLGIFTGKILLNVGGNVEEIPISISTQSKETIFDVSSTVIDRTIQDGDDVKVQIDLLPVGERGIDITLKYSIKDFKGEVYYENSETFYVNGPMSFVKEFPTDKLVRGDYVLATEMIYLGGFASASSQFEVIDESIFGGFRLTLGTMFLIGVVLVILLIVVILSFRLRKIKKIEDKDKEASKKKKKKVKK